MDPWELKTARRPEKRGPHTRDGGGIQWGPFNDEVSENLKNSMKKRVMRVRVQNIPQPHYKKIHYLLWLIAIANERFAINNTISDG